MKLVEVRIRNFRCFKEITVPLDDTTLLLGANNAGKTAFLEALRKLLPLNGSIESTAFDEYDFHMVKDSDFPQTAGDIEISLIFREDSPGEWSNEIQRKLEQMIQHDPTGRSLVHLRATTRIGPNKRPLTHWEFLDSNGNPLSIQHPEMQAVLLRQFAPLFFTVTA